MLVLLWVCSQKLPKRAQGSLGRREGLSLGGLWTPQERGGSLGGGRTPQEGERGSPGEGGTPQEGGQRSRREGGPGGVRPRQEGEGGPRQAGGAGPGLYARAYAALFSPPFPSHRLRVSGRSFVHPGHEKPSVGARAAAPDRNRKWTGSQAGKPASDPSAACGGPQGRRPRCSLRAGPAGGRAA